MLFDPAVVWLDTGVMDMTTNSNHESDRRESPRLAAEGKLHAAVLDDNNQPLIVLRDVEVLNVSAGGLALLTSTCVVPAVVVSAVVGDRALADEQHRRVTLEVLECVPQPDQRYCVRCRLLEGRMPAELLYDWFAKQGGRSVPA